MVSGALPGGNAVRSSGYSPVYTTKAAPLEAAFVMLVVCDVDDRKEVSY